MRRFFLVALGILALAIAISAAVSQDVRNTYIVVAAQVADGILTNAKLANMANSTAKCRTTSGTGVPEDCTAAQLAAIVGGVGGALKSQRITITRDLTTATGGVAYTGMGFQPTSCFAIGNVAQSITQYTNVISISDAARNTTGVVVFSSTLNVTTNFMQFFDVTASNGQIATITTYDADGLTLEWTKTSSPTGTATIYLTCYR